MKIFFESENGNDDGIGIEVIYSKENLDIHVLDLSNRNTTLMMSIDSHLLCRILEKLGERPSPELWKWFFYQADGIISWYDNGKLNPVRRVDEHLLVLRFVQLMESRCCQWYGEGRVK